MSGRPGDAVGEGAVAVEVAAGGEVSGERRRALPHLAAAAGEAVVGGGEFLVADDPETLREEDQQEKRGEALWASDVDARNGHAASIRPIDFQNLLRCSRVLLRVYRLAPADFVRAVYCGK